MVCLRNISVDNLHKTDTEDNNNNNTSMKLLFGDVMRQEPSGPQKKKYNIQTQITQDHKEDTQTKMHSNN